MVKEAVIENEKILLSQCVSMLEKQAAKILQCLHSQQLIKISGVLSTVSLDISKHLG